MKTCGESRIRTCEDIVSRFTVCPRWPLEYLPIQLNRAGRGIRTHDPEITNHVLWPTELCRLLIFILCKRTVRFCVTDCKCTKFYEFSKFLEKNIFRDYLSEIFSFFRMINFFKVSTDKSIHSSND